MVKHGPFQLAPSVHSNSEEDHFTTLSHLRPNNSFTLPGGWPTLSIAKIDQAFGRRWTGRIELWRRWYLFFSFSSRPVPLLRKLGPSSHLAPAVKWVLNHKKQPTVGFVIFLFSFLVPHLWEPVSRSEVGSERANHQQPLITSARLQPPWEALQHQGGCNCCR